jgi:hypothetical protein
VGAVATARIQNADAYGADNQEKPRSVHAHCEAQPTTVQLGCTATAFAARVSHFAAAEKPRERFEVIHKAPPCLPNDWR